MFVDKVQVSVQAGSGGNGIVSFRHEKFVDRGGPDGGDGGKGGDVIFVASRNENTLASFRYQKLLQADDGKAGSKRKQHGRSGKDLVVSIPVGTVVTDGDKAVADLNQDGQRIVIATGGKGGFGNAHFISSVRQAPRVAEKGEKGDYRELTLELKMIADVGLIGLPNAGKSTLLSVISNARPEIANYPFTTIRPNLGVVDIADHGSLLFADIPGLIEGASEGKGLGDEFLRHVERTKVLVHLIDAYTEDVAAAYKTIVGELKAYSPELIERPQIVALTKTEGFDPELLHSQKDALQKVAKTDVFAISSQAKNGLDELLYAVAAAVEKQAATAQEDEQPNQDIPVISLQDDDEAWQVAKEKGVFVVRGRKIERFASRTDFDSYHGVQRLRDIMKKMGIMHELARQKAKPEQRIYFGKTDGDSLEY